LFASAKVALYFEVAKVLQEKIKIFFVFLNYHPIFFKNRQKSGHQSAVFG
jgi:hypothetical protein